MNNAVSKRGTKITVLGTGSVGATIAYTLALEGLCSEILLVDIDEKKAEGEAMDIRQGKAFCPETDIRSGKAEDAEGSDIVIVTVGIARKPGQWNMQRNGPLKEIPGILTLKIWEGTAQISPLSAFMPAAE